MTFAFSSESALDEQTALDGTPTEPMDKATALALINVAWDAIHRLSAAHQAGKLPTDLYSDCDPEQVGSNIYGDLAPLVYLDVEELNCCAFDELTDRLLERFGMDPEAV